MQSLEMNYIEVPPVFSAYNRFSKMYNENHTFLYRFMRNGKKQQNTVLGYKMGSKFKNNNFFEKFGG